MLFSFAFFKCLSIYNFFCVVRGISKKLHHFVPRFQIFCYCGLPVFIFHQLFLISLCNWLIRSSMVWSYNPAPCAISIYSNSIFTFPTTIFSAIIHGTIIVVVITILILFFYCYIRNYSVTGIQNGEKHILSLNIVKN